MKKLNNRGFTLVEILAMMVILVVLLAISVPNISGILSRQKENISVDDANKLVESTKIKVRTKKNVELPTEDNNCNVYTMAFLDSNDDYFSGTNGGTYDKFESFVVAKKVSRTVDGMKEVSYEYYVRLFEDVDGETMGVELTKVENIEKNPKNYMKTFERKVGITKTANMSTVETNIAEINSGLCNQIERIYVSFDVVINRY